MSPGYQSGPLVSAIVSTYNSSAFLPACLEDLEAQTIADRLEIIVVDSGSQQNEREIVAAFQQRYSNIVYIRSDVRETLYAAWNRGVLLSRGAYITNANTDDSHRPDAFELLVDALETHREADLAFAWCDWTETPNDTFRNPHPVRRVKYLSYAPSHSPLYCFLGPHPVWRRGVFDKVGLFDPAFTSAGDYEFQLRFTAHGLNAVLVEECLSLFYQNANCLSHSSGRPKLEVDTCVSRYRAILPVTRFYRIDVNDRQAVTRAWIAQGLLAWRFPCPWTDPPASDVIYAAQCFETALKVDGGSRAALNNLLILYSLLGAHDRAERIVREVSPAVARTVLDSLKSHGGAGIPELVEAPPPAVEPLVYRQRAVQ